MAGLREIKKKNTKKAILEYGEKVFKEKGYSQVKTSEIAKAVGIGEGTLFNYFSSKGELFIEAVFRDFETEKYKIHIEKDINEEFLVNEIITLIDFYIKKMASVNKNLLREYFSIVFSINNAESLLTRKSLFHMDEMIMTELKELFHELKKTHRVSNEFDTDTAITCIYSCVIMQFTIFAYSDDLNYTDVIENLRQQIKLIISGNIIL
jgi:AcrR family transcriptional regulator